MLFDPLANQLRVEILGLGFTLYTSVAVAVQFLMDVAQQKYGV
jgi:hypothetical protein